MNTKLSIIIPVYNTEKYITKCLNSVFKNLNEEIEVIIIDDGSKDNSISIFKNKIKNIINCNLYIQKNIGVSETRNKGITYAKGKYIMFLDSDDYLSDNFYNDIKQELKKDYDMILYGYSKIIGNNIINYIENKEVNKENLQMNIINNENIGGYICGKIYKKSIITDNNIKFDKSIKFAEDFLFNINYSNYVEKLVYINKSLYNYVIRKNSASQIFNKDSISFS